MNESLNFGDLEADFVLTDEEMEYGRSKEGIEEARQRVEEARLEDAQLRALEEAAETPTLNQQQPTPKSQKQPPTGGETPQQQAPADSTEQPLSGETVTFNNGKTYAVEHIEYRNGIPFVKPEFNELYKDGASYLGQPIGEMGQQVRERTSAPGQGLFDFAAQAVNRFLPKGAQIPTASRYEDGVAEAARKISSVVTPTLLLQSAGMSAGAAAQTRIGWGLGNTAFMRFLGARGVEAAAAATVGAISDEYEGENITGMVKKALPPQWDFIPDSMATLDTDSPDIKRQKNINEDLGLGFLIPFVGSARKFGEAVGEVNQVFSKGNAFTKPGQALPVITAESPQAVKFIETAQPTSTANNQARRIWNDGYEDGVVGIKWEDLDEAAQQSSIQRFIDEGLITEEAADLTGFALKQEDALDELGAYNLSTRTNENVVLKGVHDLYDWNEIGLRTVDDFGIVGASLDAVRVARNYDTVYGRLGSMVSSPAIKYGNTTPFAAEEITLGLTRQLKDAGEYGMEGAGWSIKHADVLEQGNNLVLELFDPSMGRRELQQILDPYIVRTADGTEYVAEEGYASLFRAINNYSDDMTSMDIARAQSYLATSLGGQVSDLAEGMRINAGSRAIFSAQERIKDNLMYLMKLQGVTRYYANKKVASKNLFNKLVKAGQEPKPMVTSPDEVDQVIADIQKEVEIFGDSLDYLKNTHPKTAEALMELYELTDGEINSISKLNDDILHSFTKFRPLYDGKPTAPNIMMQAVRSNFFNSVLSSIGTSAQALYGNLGGTIAEPINYFAGALLRRDLDSLQRGWMAYSAIWDTQAKALPYAGKMFMKASQNPTSVKSQTRLDFVLQQEKKLDSYKKIAEEQAKQGNEGLKYLINQYEMMQHMANDPVFRLVPNTFTGFDGWTNATIANAHARFRAMSELKNLGEEANPARIKELADAEYGNMFDSNGIIQDKAVRYNSNEIALNLDTNMVKSLDELLKQWPGARMFFMFPGTMANIVKQADDYMPLPLKSFQKDINDLAFTSAEDLYHNTELMDSLLSSRGFDPSKMDDGLKFDTIIDLKNKTLGKKAVSTFIVGSIVSGMLLGKLDITGDGLYDRSAQRSREVNSDWERRTIKVGDVRVNYETILGPGLANWVAAVANVADNFDMLGETYTEKMFEKLAFTLGGSLTNQALVSSLRPLVEIASGNSFQASRWSAGIVNSFAPFGGLRNEMGRVLDGGLKIVEDDILAIIANRNQMAGLLDPSNRLPDLYNPVTGKIPNKYTLAQRLWNAYSPIKIYPEQSEEERFLQDIEFDISTTFSKREGVKLLPEERSELFRLMGEQGFFKKRVKSIMNSAAAFNTIEALKEARRNGKTSEQVSLDDFDRIHYQLGVALRDAEKNAFFELDSDMRTAIEARQQAAIEVKRRSEAGIVPELEQFTQIRN